MIQWHEAKFSMPYNITLFHIGLIILVIKTNEKLLTISWLALDFKDIEPYFAKLASGVLPQSVAKSVQVTINKPAHIIKLCSKSFLLEFIWNSFVRQAWAKVATRWYHVKFWKLKIALKKWWNQSEKRDQFGIQM